MLEWTLLFVRLSRDPMSRLSVLAAEIQSLARASGRSATVVTSNADDNTISLCGLGAETLELREITPKLQTRERLVTRALRSKGHVFQLQVCAEGGGRSSGVCA